MELPEYDVNDTEICRSDTDLHLYVSRMHLLVSQMIYLFWDNVAIPSSRFKKSQILLDISTFPDNSTKLSQNAGHNLSSNTYIKNREWSLKFFKNPYWTWHDLWKKPISVWVDTHKKHHTKKKQWKIIPKYHILSSNFQLQVMDQTHKYDIINHLICAFTYYLYPNLAYYFIQTDPNVHKKCKVAFIFAQCYI